MKKLLWISLLVGSLILSGCITLDVTTEINENGSGEHRVILAVDSSLYTPGAFDETVGDARKAGATVREYTGDGRRGVLVTYSFSNLEELSKQLNDDETVGELFDISAKKNRGLFKDTYSINVKVDTRKFLQPDATAQGMDTAALSMVDFSYAIIMPGEITSHNGTLAGGNKIVWHIDAASGRIYDLSAQSQVQNNLLPICGLCGVGIALSVIIGLGGGVFYGLRQRSAKKESGKVFCSKCGAENDRASRFCMKCGEELS